MIRIYFALLLFLLFLIPAPLLAEKADAQREFVEQFKSDSSTKFVDITSQLKPLKNFQRGENVRYESLKKTYLRQLRHCVKGNSNFASNFAEVFSRYSGKASFESPETFSAPCMLVAIQEFEPSSLEVAVFDKSFRSKKIHGLRVSASIKDVYRRIPISNLSAYYAPDLNARVAGFSYARLMLELSENVKPAENFAYNDILEWSEHNSLGKEDQINRAIPLTNYAHSSGNAYVISTHPDFAIEMQNFKHSGSLMTFFLWREEPKADAVPDFVYQLLVRPGK